MASCLWSCSRDVDDWDEELSEEGVFSISIGEGNDIGAGTPLCCASRAEAEELSQEAVFFKSVKRCSEWRKDFEEFLNNAEESKMELKGGRTFEQGVSTRLSLFAFNSSRILRSAEEGRKPP
jgi:hypothetical protein